MNRTDLMDTSEWAHRFMVEHYRAMSPAEKSRLAIGLIDAGREMHRLAMERVKEMQEDRATQVSC